MRIPLIRIVVWRGKNRVCLFLSSGRVMEVDLPWVKSAKNAHIVDGGMALDPGDGHEVSALTLVALPGQTILRGDRGWVGEKVKRNHRRSR